MKKFTKGCLLTALVTFILGCLICGVCGLFGGFRQLEGINVEELTGIPFHFNRLVNGGLRYGFGWDSDWDDDDWFAESQYRKWNSLGGSGETAELELTADTLRSLYIELGACDLYVMESDSDHVGIAMKGNTKNFRYVVKNGDTLRMVNWTPRGVLNWSVGSLERKNAGKVYLYLPQGCLLDNLDIEIGAGSMESIELRAREVSMTVGAGICELEGLTASGKIELDVGAGSIDVGSFAADKADMTVGAGELLIGNARIGREADVDLGMGNLELSGLVNGDMDIDCGMGNVTLHLDDAEEDHNFEIECSMGNVDVGSHSYTGIANERSIANGSNSTYEIDCSMGNVVIDFAR